MKIIKAPLLLAVLLLMSCNIKTQELHSPMQAPEADIKI